MRKYSDFDSHVKQCFNKYSPNLIQLNRLKASVLVPIVLQKEPSILLTVRAAHLNSHPGQISFPGGMDEEVDENSIATALRETHEEIGLPPERFNIYGELSTTVSKDGVLVYPIVGAINSVQDAIGNPDEIAEVFTVPWRFLVETKPEFQALSRQGYNFEVPHFYYKDHDIWGLTAFILLELLNIVEKTQWALPDYQQVGQSD